jgi:hypothetical protein
MSRTHCSMHTLLVATNDDQMWGVHVQENGPVRSQLLILSIDDV